MKINKVKLGNRVISKKSLPYIIAEIGVNHECSMKKAKRLIYLAKKGGASPTELMSGMRLLNNQGKVTKKARAYSDNGIFKFL